MRGPVVVPAWTEILAADEIKGILRFKFKGPGWYLTKTNCMLVVPEVDLSEFDVGPVDIIQAIERGEHSSIWQKKWPSDTLFACHVFDVEFKYTVFNLMNAGLAGLIPTRSEPFSGEKGFTVSR